MKILIIGANGFIGKHLSLLLLRIEDIEVTLFSRNFDMDFFNKIFNSSNCIYVKGDYTDSKCIEPYLKNKDIIYHLVSTSIPSSSWNNPILEIDQNLKPTLRLLEMCCLARVKKVVYLSSGGAVYGKQEGDLDENSKTLPFSPYGITKLSIERFLEYARIKNDLQYDIFRISNAYGPYLDKNNFGVINTWLRHIVNGAEISVFGDGSISKDYIYIDDVVESLSLSLYSSITTSQIYNLSSGNAYSLNDLIEIIQDQVSEENIKFNSTEPSQSDNPYVRLDNTKIKSIRKLNKIGGFTSIQSGIKSTYEYYLSKHQTLRQ
jgi:UDP-glucose 4-epimerase